MESSEVLKILRVTRQTLTNYIKEGKVTVNKISKTRYDYNEESVFNLLVNGKHRDTIGIITGEGKEADRQLAKLGEYCANKDTILDNAIRTSEGTFGPDGDFMEMIIDKVERYEIQRIIIVNKSAVGGNNSFKLLKRWFKSYGCSLESVEN